jgi:hypothetical protein
MLLPPITLQDISILLAVSAVLLLVTAELAPYASGEKTLTSDIKKLRTLAIIMGVLFLITVAIEMSNIFSKI